MKLARPPVLILTQRSAVVATFWPNSRLRRCPRCDAQRRGRRQDDCSANPRQARGVTCDTDTAVLFNAPTPEIGCRPTRQGAHSLSVLSAAWAGEPLEVCPAPHLVIDDLLIGHASLSRISTAGTGRKRGLIDVYPAGLAIVIPDAQRVHAPHVRRSRE